MSGFSAELVALACRPGNADCADCSAPNTAWASANLGIFLCTKCGSVHRSLGTHVSKVKSVKLDKWTNDQITKMSDIGNVRSNAVYEAGLDAGFVRPRWDKGGDVRRFISDKYVDKRWFSGTAVEKAKSKHEKETVYTDEMPTFDLLQLE